MACDSGMMALPADEAAETSVEVLAQQLEFCLSDTYIALSRVLQKNLVKTDNKTMSVPLSVVAAVLPVPYSHPPGIESLQAAVETIPHMEVDEEGTLTYVGRTVPAGNRIGECRRRTVVVDGLANDATSESVCNLLSECGTIVAATICHPRLTTSYVKGAFRSRTVHALVQFSSLDDAVHAVETMNFSWRGGPRVTHLMIEFRAPSPLRSRNRSPLGFNSPANDGFSSDSSKEPEDAEVLKAKTEHVSDEKGSNGGLDKDENINEGKKKKKNKKNKTNPDSDGKKAEQGTKKQAAKKDYASWAAASPENRVQPPRFTNSRMSQSVPGVIPVDGIVPRRVVKGPDGTRGFTMGRGRPLPVPAH